MNDLVTVWVALGDAVSSARLAQGLMKFAPGQMIVRTVSLEELKLCMPKDRSLLEPEESGFEKPLGFLITEGPICLESVGDGNTVKVDSSRVYMSINLEYPLMCSARDFEDYFVTVIQPQTGEMLTLAEPIANSGNARSIASCLIGMQRSMLGIEEPVSEMSRVPLVVFGSYYGGSGVTSVALSTAYMMKHIYGERVLYLSLTATDGAAQYLPNCNPTWAGHLFLSLERMVKNPDSASHRFSLDSYLLEGEFCDYLSIGTMGQHVSQTSEESIQCLLSMVKECGRYDYVFLDIGNQVQGIAESLFWKSEVPILVRPGNRVATLGEKWFLRDNYDFFREFRRDKPWIQVVNYASGTEERALMVSEATSNFIFMGGKIRIQVKGNYGLEIAEIAKQIRARVRKQGTSEDHLEDRWALSGKIETGGYWVSSGGSGGGTAECH